MTTEIICNGSTWSNQKPKPLQALFDRLEANTLEPRTAPFISHSHEFGTTTFYGTFRDASHVFRLYTDDPVLIGKLIGLIRENVANPKFFAALNDWPITPQEARP